MKQSRRLSTLAWCLVIGCAATARAGAPQPDQRQGDFAHVCQGGPNKTLACTVPTQDVDCPKSACVVKALSSPIKATLTIIAHDAVTDWLNGGATNRALTLLLEVKAPDGSRQMLAATYQDLTAPSEPPAAPSDIVAIAMDEDALASAFSAVGGMRFVRPESALSLRLQELFGNPGTPVIIAAEDRRVESADHTRDDLASVLRFKVKIQFVEPL